MIGLFLALIGLGKSFLISKNQSEQTKASAMSDYWKYQIAFIQATAGVETRVVRQLIVLSIAGALYSAKWGALLAANLQALPLAGKLILVWEFFGAAALNILPWYKGAGDTNGDGMADVPAPMTIPQAQGPLTMPEWKSSQITETHGGTDK
jgi:hypothetical protein